MGIYARESENPIRKFFVPKSQYLNVEKIHLENLFISIQTQIDKLKTAILFLKSGIVDPYLVEPKEFMKFLTPEHINMNVTNKDIDIMMYRQKPVAVFD